MSAAAGPISPLGWPGLASGQSRFQGDLKIPVSLCQAGPQKGGAERAPLPGGLRAAVSCPGQEDVLTDLEEAAHPTSKGGPGGSHARVSWEPCYPGSRRSLQIERGWGPLGTVPQLTDR